MLERRLVLAFGVGLAIFVAYYAVTMIHTAFARATAQVECIRDPSVCPTTSR